MKMNNHNNSSRDMDMMEQLMHGIEEIEYRIANFSGKKVDRRMLMKELEKAKCQRNALQNKLDKERNKEIKWKNKGKGQQKYHREEVKINTSAIARTIAI